MTTRRRTTKAQAATSRTATTTAATSRKSPAGAIKGSPALRSLSLADMSARLDITDKAIRRATHCATTAMRGSMADAAAAAKSVRVSMKQAVAAVRRASRGIARRLTVAARSMTAETTANRAATVNRRGR